MTEELQDTFFRELLKSTTSIVRIQSSHQTIRKLSRILVKVECERGIGSDG